jgi:hypothetical protein
MGNPFGGKMKKIYAVLLLTLITTAALAANSPYPPWIDKVGGDITFDANGGTSIGAGKITEAQIAPLSGTVDGLGLKRMAMFVYDSAIDGVSAAGHGLGVTLPAGAVITRSFFKVITAFTYSGSANGTLALSCEDANNIYTATANSGQTANSFVEGASTGTAATMVRGIASACEITATPSVIVTAGKLIGWLEFVVEN